MLKRDGKIVLDHVNLLRSCYNLASSSKTTSKLHLCSAVDTASHLRIWDALPPANFLYKVPKCVNDGMGGTLSFFKTKGPNLQKQLELGDFHSF